MFSIIKGSYLLKRYLRHCREKISIAESHFHLIAERQTSHLAESDMEMTADMTSDAEVLRLVTRSSARRTSAQRTGHFRTLALSLCFERTN